MLKVENLNFKYGNGKGVSDISFSLKPGRIQAVLGTNGSGKTTSFRLLLGLLIADSGVISLDGKPLDINNKCLCGYLPEERSLLRCLKVSEQITYLARLKGMNDLEIVANLDYWLDWLNIEQYRDAKISELSKGNQQKVQMACALMHNPRIVIFDEPLNGLDIENVDLFKRLLNKLKKAKKYILISSHQYNNIEQYCDQLLYLEYGQILFKGDVSKLKKRANTHYLKINCKDDSYAQSNGVKTVVRDGRYLILNIDNQEDCYALVSRLCQDGVDDFSLELSSLQDIIRDKSQ